MKCLVINPENNLMSLCVNKNQNRTGRNGNTLCKYIVNENIRCLIIYSDHVFDSISSPALTGASSPSANGSIALNWRDSGEPPPAALHLIPILPLVSRGVRTNESPKYNPLLASWHGVKSKSMAITEIHQRPQVLSSQTCSSQRENYRFLPPPIESGI